MERWSSNLGFLLATIGAAVGLGNIWRFSAVVGQNGGGAYLIPYLLAAFVLAVPLLVLELAIGRSVRTDVVSAFKSTDERFAPLGWVVVGGVLLILSYYLVLTGWVLSFLAAAISGTELVFTAFTDGWWPVVAFVVTTALTALVVDAGVKDGIERLVKLVMPLVFVLLAALAVYAATLDGFGDATAFLFTPDVRVLSDPGVWSAAVGQVFFSLSVGQGIMLTYGAYVGEDVDLVRSALLITVADIAVALLAGLVIFPVVFTFGLAPAAGTELAFTTLPRAFAALDAGSALPVGRLVAVGFFGLLFAAALTSAVSLLEVGVAAAQNAASWTRRRATVVLTSVVFVAGLPSALSYSAAHVSLAGAPVLDVLDESVGTYALPVSALLLLAAFLWVSPDARRVVKVELRGATVVARYVLPVVLVVITGAKLAGVARPAWSTLVSRTTTIGFVALVVALTGLLGAGWALRKRGRTQRFRRRRD